MDRSPSETSRRLNKNIKYLSKIFSSIIRTILSQMYIPCNTKRDKINLHKKKEL